MEPDILQITRDGWEAFSRGDVDAALRPFAADVEWDVSRDIWGDVMGGGHYSGHDGILTWLRELYDAWETFEITPEEHIKVSDDAVMTVLAAHGRGRASGVKVEHHPAGIVTFRDGRAVRVVWYPSRAEAAAAAKVPSR